MNRYDIDYYLCNSCVFLQTEEPYWLNESYRESINITDTGILARNYDFARITAVIIYFLMNKNGKFLDFAGGYGIFTRLMRDIGFDFYWSDLYSKNLVARGFEYSADIGQVGLVTSFESFEHFLNPMKEIEEMLSYSRSLLFSTWLLPDPIPQPNKWWYYGLEHGQHISFYSLKTLQWISSHFNLRLYSNGNYLHLLTDRKISPFYFRVLTRLYNKRPFYWVTKRMKSKTLQDMYHLIAKK